MICDVILQETGCVQTNAKLNYPEMNTGSSRTKYNCSQYCANVRGWAPPAVTAPLGDWSRGLRYISPHRDQSLRWGWGHAVSAAAGGRSTHHAAYMHRRYRIGYMFVITWKG